MVRAVIPELLLLDIAISQLIPRRPGQRTGALERIQLTSAQPPRSVHTLASSHPGKSTGSGLQPSPERVQPDMRRDRFPSQDLAAHSGLNENYISNVELGRKEICIRALKKIAPGLGVPLAKLMEGL